MRLFYLCWPILFWAHLAWGADSDLLMTRVEIMELYQGLKGSKGQIPQDHPRKSFLNGQNFEDIFLGTKGKTHGVSSYHFLNPKTLKIHRSDKKNTAFKICEKVSIQENDSKWSFRYCAGYDQIYNRERVFYFFHGLSGEPGNFWRRGATSLLRDIWREKKDSPPWVSLSFGRIGILSEPEMLRRMKDIMIPYIEKKIGFHVPPKERFILGVSMGGGNALYGIQKEPQLFQKAFLVCPAVSLLVPGSERRHIHDYVKRTGAYFQLIVHAYSLLPRIFFDPSYFDSVDPFIAGQRDFGPHTPPIYIQTSSRDEFGFQEGGQVLAMVARSRGVKVQFDEIKGGHCVFEPETAVNFFRSEL
jgi:hypothetical protein